MCFTFVFNTEIPYAYTDNSFISIWPLWWVVMHRSCQMYGRRFWCIEKPHLVLMLDTQRNKFLQKLLLKLDFRQQYFLSTLLSVSILCMTVCCALPTYLGILIVPRSIPCTVTYYAWRHAWRNVLILTSSLTPCLMPWSTSSHVIFIFIFIVYPWRLMTTSSPTPILWQHCCHVRRHAQPWHHVRHRDCCRHLIVLLVICFWRHIKTSSSSSS